MRLPHYTSLSEALAVQETQREKAGFQVKREIIDGLPERSAERTGSEVYSMERDWTGSEFYSIEEGLSHSSPKVDRRGYSEVTGRGEVWDHEDRRYFRTRLRLRAKVRTLNCIQTERGGSKRSYSAMNVEMLKNNCVYMYILCICTCVCICGPILVWACVSECVSERVIYYKIMTL